MIPVKNSDDYTFKLIELLQTPVRLIIRNLNSICLSGSGHLHTILNHPALKVQGFGDGLKVLFQDEI